MQLDEVMGESSQSSQHIPLTSLAVEGPARSGKTRRLLEHTVQCLAQNPSQHVLVLCSNYARKDQFLNALMEQLGEGGRTQLQVTTYSALVRSTLNLFWPAAEQILTSQSKVGGRAVIFPELSGFEATEYLVKRIVAQYRQTNEQAFTEFRGTPQSLVRQLIRRIRLRSENRLTGQEMQRRSAVIGEPCQADVAYVLTEFDRLSAKLRVFDNSKQIDVFHRLITQNDAVAAYFTERVRHLVVDDLDETTAAQQHFIQWLAPSLETLAMAADVDGGTRRGYLNAYPYDWPLLKSLKADTRVEKLSRDDTFYPIAQTILANWTQPPEHSSPAVLPVTQSEMRWQAQTLSRMEMLAQVVVDVAELLKKRSPDEIVLVMPKVDVIARMMLAHQFSQRAIPVQFLTGTERPMDNPVCRSLAWLIQWVYQAQWQWALSPHEFHGLLRYGLRLHTLDPVGTERLVDAYRKRAPHEWGGPEGEDFLNPPALSRYQAFCAWVDRHRDDTLETLIYQAFSDVLAPHLDEQSTLGDMVQLTRSLYIKTLAELLMTTDSTEVERLAAREWLVQLKTGIVADSPNKPAEADSEAVVIGSPQKVIDLEIERPVQLWLDVTSREWSRTDNAPLYNAWVHSVNWDGNTEAASDEFNQLLAYTRAGHITRTLALYAGEWIGLYASEWDDEGEPHSGVFHQMLPLSESDVNGVSTQRAVLREDQAPVLSYQSGPMAITAVPGAGKTFVNIELLLELMSRGLPGEKILVLTYMESAAKTMLSRLKYKLGTSRSSGLPVVSTIHSLALRLISEADHAVYLGLDPQNIRIIDEFESRDLLMPIVNWIDNGEGYFTSPDSVMGLLQRVKAYRVSPKTLKSQAQQMGIRGGRLWKFVLIYEAYQKAMRSQGMLDFTDLITEAITLLESREDVRALYQSRFQVVIEDEAQDSSLLLQQFIGLLSASHGNLIRTGDTNQSITTTFSTADTTVFREFITQCDTEGQVVRMTQSARCAPEIITLANQFLTWASSDSLLSSAFVPVQMTPVVGQNPAVITPPSCLFFEDSRDEDRALCDAVKSACEDYPQLSKAVLVRGNHDVIRVTRLLQDAGITAVSMTESPQVNPVFCLIVHTLALLESPSDLTRQSSLYESLVGLGLLLPDPSLEVLFSETTLLQVNPVLLSDTQAMQMAYHLHDLQRDAYGSDMARLVIRLSELMFSDPQHRSTGYLLALKCQSWVDELSASGILDYSPLEWVNQKLGDCMRRQKLPVRSLMEISSSSSATGANFVQVMTLHKSKGQEFDFVWMPGMTERTFASSIDSLPWRDGDKLEVELERVRCGGVMSREEIEARKKREKIEEEARLVYVGLTRAKRSLTLSASRTSLSQWMKLEKTQPSRFIMAIHGILYPQEVSAHG